MLDRSFYVEQDCETIAQRLLGKLLITEWNGLRTSGRIVETEAYIAPEDQASHARNNRRTPRTETFWTIGGTAYVYISYGVHHLFNVITGPESSPHAVLIRAIEPMDGIELMQQRRKNNYTDKRLTGGPGRLSVALGIRVQHDGMDLCNPASPIQIHDVPDLPSENIRIGPRIGIDPVSEPWLSKPYRYWIADNRWVSR